MAHMSAIISPCGRYRYRLDRRWGDGRTMGFIMLNPSTADAENDDPTIRRCIGFAKREGCDAIAVVNLYALRTPNPKDVLKAKDPHGNPVAEFYRQQVYRQVDGPLIAAWGQWPIVPIPLPENLMCLGRTKNGSPRHPLYLRSDQPLEKY